MDTVQRRKLSYEKSKAGDQKDEKKIEVLFSVLLSFAMFAIGLRTEVPKRDNAMNAKNHPLNILYEIFHISLLT